MRGCTSTRLLACNCYNTNPGKGRSKILPRIKHLKKRNDVAKVLEQWPEQRLLRSLAESIKLCRCSALHVPFRKRRLGQNGMLGEDFGRFE
jgi:hypothetical protein